MAALQWPLVDVLWFAVETAPSSVVAPIALTCTTTPEQGLPIGGGGVCCKDMCQSTGGFQTRDARLIKAKGDGV
jgi:hypothetical protein